MCIGENALDSGEKCGRPSSSGSRFVLNEKYSKIRRWPWTVSDFFLLFLLVSPARTADANALA